MDKLTYDLHMLPWNFLNNKSSILYVPPVSDRVMCYHFRSSNHFPTYISYLTNLNNASINFYPLKCEFFQLRMFTCDLDDEIILSHAKTYNSTRNDLTKNYLILPERCSRHVNKL